MIDYDKQFANDSGSFYVPETRQHFTFIPTSGRAGDECPWAIKHNLIHFIPTYSGGMWAIVRKTVAYVAVDEDAYGNPVLERWRITNRKPLSFGE